MAEKIEGIFVEIGLDDTQLQKGIKTTNQNIKALATDLSGLNSKLKLDSTNVDLLQSKFKTLQGLVDENRKKVEQLKAKQDALGDKELNVDEWNKLQSQITSAENKTNGYIKALNETESELRNLGSTGQTEISKLEKASIKAEAGLKKVSEATEQAANKMKPLSLAAAGALTVLFGLSVKAGKAADDINTMAKVTGLSTDTLQKFAFASERIDVSLETLATSLKKNTKSVFDARNGNKDLQETYARLGVTLEDNNGKAKTSEQVFNESVKALGNIEDQVERDATAMKLFGKSATDLNPLILGGADALMQMADEMENLGLVMSQEELDKVNEFNDEVDRTKAVTQAAATKIGAAFAPQFSDIVNLAAKAALQVKEFTERLSDKQKGMIVKVLAVVAAITPMLLIISKLSGSLSGVFGVVKKVTTSLGGLSKVFGLIASPVGIVVVAIAALIALLVYAYKTNEEFRKTVNKLVSDILKALLPVIESLKKVFVEQLFPALVKLYEAIMPLVIHIFNAYVKYVQEFVIPVFKAIMEVVINILIPAFVKLVEFISKYVIPILIDIVNVITGVLKAAFDLIKWVIENVLIPAFNKVKWVIDNVLIPAFNFVKDKISEVIGFIEKIVSWVATMYDKFMDSAPIQAFKDALGGILGVLDDIIGKVQDAINWFSNLFGKQSKASDFSSGGGYGIGGSSTGVRAGGFGDNNVTVNLSYTGSTDFNIDALANTVASRVSKAIARGTRNV